MLLCKSALSLHITEIGGRFKTIIEVLRCVTQHTRRMGTNQLEFNNRTCRDGNAKKSINKKTPTYTAKQRMMASKCYHE